MLDFLQAVRGNESRKLDLLWREFFASAHTGTANKTQYVPMSIMRVFWGMAMTPELDALYHRIRTIPMGDSLGCNVGWAEGLGTGTALAKLAPPAPKSAPPPPRLTAEQLRRQAEAKRDAAQIHANAKQRRLEAEA